MPAIRRCGILAISQKTILPAISVPRATLSLLFERRNSSESTHSRIPTVCLVRFGTSMPMAVLFGIAAIRTPEDASLNAMSSASRVTLLIFIPTSGSISYLVTEGPLQIPTICAPTPKLSRVSMSF